MTSFMGSLVSADGTINTLVDGKPYLVSPTHPNYFKVVKAFKDRDAELFVSLVDIPAAVERFVSSSVATSHSLGVVVQDGQVFYNGEPVDSSISSRIVALMNEGFDVSGLLKFLENLMDNPSANSVQELYSFLANKNLPITDDGCFLAYKTVVRYYGEPFVDVNGLTVSDGDNVDKFSSKVRNNVGDSPEMTRNKVDDNCERHCSYGYHVGALSYAGPGGWYNSSSDIVVIVKVNPRDAVSVPRDHDFTKLRVCRYEVVAVYQGALEHAQYESSNVYDDDDEDRDNWDEDEEDFDYEDNIDLSDVRIGDKLSFDYTDNDFCSGGLAAVQTRIFCFWNAKF